MNSVDLSPLITPILGALGLVLAGLLTLIANKAINALQTRNLIHLTAQQQAAVVGAMSTGAGILMARVARGVVPLEHVNVTSAEVANLAREAIARVPDYASALGVTEESAAAMLVGQAGKLIAADPTIPTVPVMTTKEVSVNDSSGAAASEVSTSTTTTAPVAT